MLLATLSTAPSFILGLFIYGIKSLTFISGNNYPSIDHVIPVSKGGTHTWDNVKLAHRHCNTMKSNDLAKPEDNGQLKLII